MIPGDLLSAFPHRQFHSLPGLLDSWAALPNSKPNACVPMQGGSLYHFYDGLWYDPAERRTHDLPCERRTRYRLSQPETVGIQVFHCSSVRICQGCAQWCCVCTWLCSEALRYFCRYIICDHAQFTKSHYYPCQIRPEI